MILKVTYFICSAQLHWRRGILQGAAQVEEEGVLPAATQDGERHQVPRQRPLCAQLRIQGLD